ncbi:MAG TPA: hypothetical protein VD968_18565 [Pyrinomonadaceae bacterium]|nr:hypothetical protein [Pyrinomonadaceae bacterium]
MRRENCSQIGSGFDASRAFQTAEQIDSSVWPGLWLEVSQIFND